jgi:hypothetical protein
VSDAITRPIPSPTYTVGKSTYTLGYVRYALPLVPPVLCPLCGQETTRRCREMYSPLDSPVPAIVHRFDECGCGYRKLVAE